jgi:hypothetical protein
LATQGRIAPKRRVPINDRTAPAGGGRPVKIYDPRDDSFIGEFGLTVGGWDNWRTRKWERCFMPVREPIAEAQFLFPDTSASQPVLRMELWVREFDEFLQQPRSLYGSPRKVIEYAIAVDDEVMADLARMRLMTIEDRIAADKTYRKLKAEREHLKKGLAQTDD